MSVIKRQAARAVLLTPENEILLLKLNNRKMGWEGWITLGGGVDPGESDHQALIRELYEEVGLDSFVIGAHIWSRTHQLHWANQDIEQSEKYYLIKVDKFEPKPTLALNEHEQEAFEGFKWWSPSELLKSKEVFAPRTLPQLLSDLIHKGLNARSAVIEVE